MQFKCTNAYCIPWSYVCDGKWDCPDGSDEIYDLICGSDRPCQYMYKCHDTNITCIHLGTVCDSIQDCPLGDDEKLCELQNSRCPLICTCLIFAVECENNIWKSKLDRHPYGYVMLQNVSNLPFRNLQTHFPDMFVSILRFNKYTFICRYIPPVCRYLDVRNNCIMRLQHYCFRNSPKIKFLILSHNCISHIEKHAFAHLNDLSVLDLSDNIFTFLPQFFSEIVHLNMLILNTQHLNSF